MSRVSGKSSLSPTSGGINLQKDGDVDLGKKTQTSASSGGIGLSQEVGQIGGMSISGGVSVDVSPIELDISATVDASDPNKNSISIAGSAELPGGLIGLGGGVKINANTGEVIGGSISGEIGGFGVEFGADAEEGLSLTLSYQIPFTPVTISIGFGQKKEEKKEPTTTPTPTPTNNPLPPLPLGCSVTAVILRDRDVTFGFDNNQPVLFPTEENYLYGIVPFIEKPEWEDKAFLAATNSTGLWWLEQFDGFTYELGKWEDFAVANEAQDYRMGAILSASPQCGNIFTPSPSPSLSSPPSPNPPPRKEMDECCRLSIRLLRLLYKGMGISKFPGNLPSTIIQKVENGSLSEPPPKPIADWVDLFMWAFERDDERWGQWEVQIDIKDADITKEGDQKKQIRLPNLAESIAEIEGQILSIMTNVDALVAMQVKCLVESGMARQEAIKGYLASKAIIKYMAFKYTEKDFTVPLSFTIEAESISGLIKESEGHIAGLDYEEKETLRDLFADLLQAAAIIRAVHWQRIDTKRDTKSQLLGLLKGSVDLANTLTNTVAKDDDDGETKFMPKDDFEDFVDKVEDGFRNETGVTDTQNPYGRTPDRRPRIRQIGDNIAQAGEKK
jgi:hypothetical protein